MVQSLGRENRGKEDLFPFHMCFRKGFHYAIPGLKLTFHVFHLLVKSIGSKLTPNDVLGSWELTILAKGFFAYVYVGVW